MKKILLVATLDPWADVIDIDKFSFLGTKSVLPPISLATIAALTIDSFKVDIWDEAIRGPIDAIAETENLDLVGITGYTCHIPRAIEIAAMFRKRQIPVVIGGVGVSSDPERCRPHFDVLFIGEAEMTWPQFMSDWQSNNYRKEYRQITKPDMALSPPPKWEIIADQMKSYLSGNVQTTRGCPFNCEFCDIIYLFGRKSRHKPVDNVLKEIAALERLGIKRIFFSDDNFIGNPRYTKELLQKLISLNNSFETPLEFSTQLSMNVAHDEELLELLADANFGSLFIGIESISEESLKETNKLQNTRGDLVKDCVKVQSYGLLIKAGMIVGFDHDDERIFKRQFDFLQQAHIPTVNVNPLIAPIGTKLWRRLLREKRVIKADIEAYEAHLNNPIVLSFLTNIIPKKMTRVELIYQTAKLMEQLHAWDNFVPRIQGYISGIKRKPRIAKNKIKFSIKALYQVIRAMIAVDKETRRSVFKIISYTKKHAPYLMSRVIVATIMNYVRYYLSRSTQEDLENVVRIEKGLDINKYIDHSQVIVPKSFEDSFKDIYLDIYLRVKSNLNDKSRINEALVDVFTDFLTRSGKTFDQMSDHHMEFLRDLCDRTVNRLNLESEKQTPDSNMSAGTMTMEKNRSSSEDILNIIEQKLRA